MKIYIPIGSNCEVSHILRNNNLRLFAFPLKFVYKMLINNFDFFLDNIYIGEKVNRLYFDDNETETKI